MRREKKKKKITVEAGVEDETPSDVDGQLVDGRAKSRIETQMENGLMLLVAPSSLLGYKFLEVAFFFLIASGWQRLCYCGKMLVASADSAKWKTGRVRLTTLEEDLRTREGATSHPGPPAVTWI